MGANTKIEWCQHTFNPWRGCAAISPGCDHCYARQYSVRQPEKFGTWGRRGKRVVAADSTWRQPLAWNRAAEKAGERRRVFCGSLCDVFEDRSELDDARRRLFGLIELTPALDWLLLTKRPDNIMPVLKRLAHHDGVAQIAGWLYITGLPRNLWLGVSAENQEMADLRIPDLLAIPAKVHFVSLEPLLKPVLLDADWLYFRCPYCRRHADFCDCDIQGEYNAPSTLNWVIVGGESGPRARPMHPDWPRLIRDDCRAAGLPFFFKQRGEWLPVMDCRMSDSELSKLPRHRFKDDKVVYRVGKKQAGRLLDGRTWDELPILADEQCP